MSAMVLACIAVLVVAGLAFYAIHRKASFKFSARALRQFEVSIEVASQSGSVHGRLSTEPDDSTRGLSQPDKTTQTDRQSRGDQPIAIVGGPPDLPAGGYEEDPMAIT